jgi:hypothetical protein
MSRLRETAILARYPMVCLIRRAWGEIRIAGRCASNQTTKVVGTATVTDNYYPTQGL